MTAPRTAAPSAGDDRPGPAPSVQLCLYAQIPHVQVFHGGGSPLDISLFDALNLAQDLIRQAAVGLAYVSASTGAHSPGESNGRDHTARLPPHGAT